MPDQRSLREKLLQTVDDMEAIITLITEKLLGERKLPLPSQPVLQLPASASFGGGVAEETMESLAQLFHQSSEECEKLLETFPEYERRENKNRQLQRCVDELNRVIFKVMRELKVVDTQQMEATAQAEKKLQSVHQSETNRAFSEDIVRLAHHLSKSYAVLSPNDWKQGDSTRPFPTENDFAQTHMMRGSAGGSGTSAVSTTSDRPSTSHSSDNRQQPSTSAAGSIAAIGGSSSVGMLGRHPSSSGLMEGLPRGGIGISPSGSSIQQKPYTPGSRNGGGGGIYCGSDSPRGRAANNPAGGAMRSGSGTWASASQAQTSPRGGGQSRRPSHSPQVSTAAAVQLSAEGGDASMSPAMNAFNAATTSTMTSDSSSSSSSGDEAVSPENQ